MKGILMCLKPKRIVHLRAVEWGVLNASHRAEWYYDVESDTLFVNTEVLNIEGAQQRRQLDVYH